jgi:ATP-dependent Clp protease ATP-binding subunit ClpC
MEHSTEPVTVRITPRTRNVLALAGEVARRHGQDFIGSEHLLLALIEDGNGIAAQVLQEVGAAEAARTRTEQILDSESYHASSPGTASVTPTPIRLTIPAEQILGLG